MLELNLEEEKDIRLGANLKVIGIGGAGGNAVNSMISSPGFEKVEFILANTDAQALAQSPVERKIQLGTKVTKGLGAGSNPDVGRRSAEEDIEEVVHQINNTDILFLTAGLGGGTGSGALPVVAQIAKEMGILSVAIVTKPFTFEGRRRLRIAQEAIESLKQTVDTLIVVPNQKLLELVDPKISMLDAFSLSNSILNQAIKGISDIITRPGHINVDFADVRSVMKDMGMALMGTGRAEGEGRAQQAAVKAISSQLLEDASISGAQGVLINITGNTDLGLHEINEAAGVVYDMVSEEANIILGSVIDPEIGNEIMVTIIATGFDDAHDSQTIDPAKAAVDTVVTTSAVSVQATPEPVEQEKRVEHEAEKSAAQTIQERIKAVETEQLNREVAAQPAGKKVEEQKTLVSEASSPQVDDDAFDLTDLDTPAFLRKKAQARQERSQEE